MNYEQVLLDFISVKKEHTKILESMIRLEDQLVIVDTNQSDSGINMQVELKYIKDEIELNRKELIEVGIELDKLRAQVIEAIK